MAFSTDSNPACIIKSSIVAQSSRKLPFVVVYCPAGHRVHSALKSTCRTARAGTDSGKQCPQFRRLLYLKTPGVLQIRYSILDHSTPARKRYAKSCCSLKHTRKVMTNCTFHDEMSWLEGCCSLKHTVKP